MSSIVNKHEVVNNTLTQNKVFLYKAYIFHSAWNIQVHLQLNDDYKYVPEILQSVAVAYRGGVRGLAVPPPKLLSFDKDEPNSQFRGKYIHNNKIRIQGSLTRELLPPDLPPLCPLFSTEFVDPPQTKFLDMPLVSRLSKHYTDS
jgi:hypothetical protein